MAQSLLLNLEDFVRITNNSKDTIWGRYDGKDYEWRPGEFLDVHKIVATHIFGWLDPEAQYSEKDAREIRERAMLRLGWVSGPRNFDQKYALGKLREVSIEAVPPFPNVRVLRARDARGEIDEYRMPSVEILPDGSEPEPAPRVAPGTPVGSGAQGQTILGPEDPQENLHQPRRVEPALQKKGAGK